MLCTATHNSIKKPQLSAVLRESVVPGRRRRKNISHYDGWKLQHGTGPIPVIENEQTKKLVGIVTCRPEDDLQKALDAMSEHQLRRIPVVDDDNKLVGIIAQADVATRVNQPQKTAEMVKEISQSSPK